MNANTFFYFVSCDDLNDAKTGVEYLDFKMQRMILDGVVPELHAMNDEEEGVIFIVCPRGTRDLTHSGMPLLNSMITIVGDDRVDDVCIIDGKAWFNLTGTDRWIPHEEAINLPTDEEEE